MPSLIRGDCSHLDTRSGILASVSFFKRVMAWHAVHGQSSGWFCLLQVNLRLLVFHQLPSSLKCLALHLLVLLAAALALLGGGTRSPSASGLAHSRLFYP